MRGKLIGVLVAGIATLAAAGTAVAADPSALRLAQQAATRYWHAAPCPAGGVTIRYAPSAAAPTDDTGGVQTGPGALWGWASFATSTPDEPGSYSDCSITLNQDVLSPAQEIHKFPIFCALMVHEYGHFFGHEDTPGTSPRSIDYPTISQANMFVRPCTDAYLDAYLLAGAVPRSHAVRRKTPELLASRAERRSTHGRNRYVGR